MGGVFGFFLGSLSQMTNPTATQPIDPGQRGKASVGSEVSHVECAVTCSSRSRCAIRTSRERAWRDRWPSSVVGRSSLFSVIAVYTALECVIERVLGTKSIWTNAIAGCGAGLAFGAKNGPTVRNRLVHITDRLLACRVLVSPLLVS